jgi:IS30 family transposase
MVRGRRDWTHREELLERVAAGGCSVRSVAASLGVPYRTAVDWWNSAAMGVSLQIGARGGVGERLPPPREKSGRLLSSEDRAVIQAGLSRRLSLREIGRLISRDASVVCREIKRNSGRDGVYRARVADRQATARRKRPKEYKLRDPELCRRIEAWMDEGWSPGLIAKVLAAEAGPDHTRRVSHETIYQALYVQSRGHLRQDLARQLSTARTRRRPRGRAQRPAIYSQALRISQRPPEVADRAVPGHWEGDLILGEGNRSAIGTLVERATRFTMLLHLPGAHTAEEVAAAMVAQMRQLPAHLRRSITWDRGTELARYADIQLDLQAPVYFADPHSPWQRGSNENTNRLLRFWFTKGSDLSLWDAEAIRRVQDSLNRRPRPTLDMRTPAQALNELLLQPAVA